MRLSGGHKGKGSDKESNAGENKGSDEVDLRRDSGTDIGCTWSSVHSIHSWCQRNIPLWIQAGSEYQDVLQWSGYRGTESNLVISWHTSYITSSQATVLCHSTQSPPFLLVEILFTVYDYMHVWFQVDSCHFEETRHRFYTSSSVHCLVMFTVEYYSVPEDFVKYNTFCGSEGVLSIMRN